MPLILNNRYLPIELLGAKTSGAMFLARDLYSETEQKCVVQQFQIRRQLFSEQREAITAQIKQEIRRLAVLSTEHQQVPALYPYFHFSVAAFSGSRLSSEKDEFFYLVQQHIEGASLAEELQQRGQFSDAEILEVMLQLLPLLQFLHGHSYRTLHQNITPETIWRDRQGLLYLMNFGSIQTLIDRVSIQASPGSDPSWFASPEQRAGQPLSPCSDLYSLAVTLVALRTDQNLELMLDPVNYRWNWSAYAQLCSSLLAQILDKMLQPAPGQRYQSAAEVLAALAPLVLSSEESIRVTGISIASSKTVTADPEVPIASPEPSPEILTVQPLAVESAKESFIPIDDDPIADALPLPTVELLTESVADSIDDPIDEPVAGSTIVIPAAEISLEGSPESSLKTSPTELEWLKVTDVEDVRVPPDRADQLIWEPAASEDLPSTSLLGESEMPRESAFQSAQLRPAARRTSAPLETEQPLLPADLVRQSLLLGSGSWLVAVILLSFVGTLLASGLWLWLLAVVVCGFWARRQPLFEQVRFLAIAIVAVGATFLLVPQLLNRLDIVQLLPQVLLLAVAAGLFAFILIVLSQWIDDFIDEGQ
jgi:serine/threonine protein kinase